MMMLSRRLFVTRAKSAIWTFGVFVVGLAFLLSCQPLPTRTIRTTGILKGNVRDRSFELTESGFIHQEFDYKIAWADPKRRAFLNGEWKIENFYKNRRRTGKERIVEFAYDSNGNGKVDERYNEWKVDLKLEHYFTDAEITVRLLPLSGEDSHKYIDVLARRLVRAHQSNVSIGFSVYGATDFSDEFSNVGSYDESMVSFSRNKTSNTTAVITEFGETFVDDVPAFWITAEIADVDQLRIDPTSRILKVKYIVLRAPFTVRRAKEDYPLLMILSLEAPPEDFDEHLVLLDQLASQITLPKNQDESFPDVPPGCIEFVRKYFAAPNDHEALERYDQMPPKCREYVEQRKYFRSQPTPPSKNPRPAGKKPATRPGSSPAAPSQNPGTAPGNQNPGTAPAIQNPGTAPANQNPGTAPANQNPGTAPGNQNPENSDQPSTPENPGGDTDDSDKNDTPVRPSPRPRPSVSPRPRAA